MSITKDYHEILQSVSSTNISDALDRLSIQGILDGIKAVHDNNKSVFGRVVTVKLTDKKVDNPPNLGVEAVENAKSGQIIVMANEGRVKMACWGGILSTASKEKRISSVIIDGACRDIDEINSLDFPVYARGVAIRSAKNRVYQEAINVPVMVSDVKIKPNDIIFGDQNGVVCIPQEFEEKILSQAWKLYQVETEMTSEIISGKSIGEVNSDPKFNDILKMSDQK
ncbi:MAG: RraA family protein [Candidatus Kariarchaeaceae archaeon]